MGGVRDVTFGTEILKQIAAYARLICSEHPVLSWNQDQLNTCLSSRRHIANADVFIGHHQSSLTSSLQHSHLFLRVSGDAGPLVFLNTVGPEVGQVLSAVPTSKQVHGFCQAKRN